jgi:hypothetical protein
MNARAGSASTCGVIAIAQINRNRSQRLTSRTYVADRPKRALSGFVDTLRNVETTSETGSDGVPTHRHLVSEDGESEGWLLR